jgi:hypothetical protein
MHLPVFIRGDTAVCQRESPIACRMVQGDGQVGVVIRQVGKGLGNPAEQRRLGGRLFHLHGEHGYKLVFTCKKITALTPGKCHRHWLVA